MNTNPKKCKYCKTKTDTPIQFGLSWFCSIDCATNLSLKNREKHKKADQIKKHSPLKPKPFKSKEYLAWFHSQGYGCMVCGAKQIEAHHIMQGNRGRQDDLIVPLCPDHHRGKFSPHGADAKEFHEAYPKDLQIGVAKKLFGAWNETVDTN